MSALQTIRHQYKYPLQRDQFLLHDNQGWGHNNISKHYVLFFPEVSQFHFVLAVRQSSDNKLQKKEFDQLYFSSHTFLLRKIFYEFVCI